MPDKVWETTDHDREVARFGIELQKECLTEEEFIDNLVESKAAMLAQIRFLTNTIHRHLGITGDSNETKTDS